MSNLTKLRALYRELGRKQIKVGFFEHSHYPDGTPIAYVAAIHELGYPAGGIPPRPFFRPAMAEHQHEYADLTARAVAAAVRETISLQNGLSQIGAKAAGDVQLAIQSVTTPPLKSATIAARARRHSRGMASAKPLVDSGQMLQAVNYVVENK